MPIVPMPYPHVCAMYRLYSKCSKYTNSSFPLIYINYHCPSDTVTDVVILNITENRQCSPNYNLGTTFANKSECAAAALVEPLCKTGEIMWSDTYNQHWGCRCCTITTSEGVVYSDHNLWDLCTYGELTGPFCIVPIW